MKEKASEDVIVDLMVKEQSLNTLPQALCVCFTDRKPKTSIEAGQMSMCRLGSHSRRVSKKD